MRPIQPKLLEIPVAKLNGKKASGKIFSKIWVYLTRLFPFWKFLKILFHSLLEVAKNSKRKFWLNGKRPFFPGRNVPNGISCSVSKKPPLIPFSGLRGHFSVDGTDFYNLYSSWMKSNSPEFCLPFAQTKHFYKTFTLPFVCSKFTLDVSYMKPPYCIFSATKINCFCCVWER